MKYLLELLSFTLQRAKKALALLTQGIAECSYGIDIEWLVAFVERALQILLLEEHLCYLLQFAPHVPGLAVVELLLDVLCQPRQYLAVVAAKTLDKVLYGDVDDGLVIEVDLQTGVQPQFVSHSSQYTLEEGIDGGNVETAVVVQYRTEGLVASLAHLFVSKHFLVELLGNALYVSKFVLAPGTLLPDVVEELQNAVLHFGCGLVGEGDSQRVTILTMTSHHEERDVLNGQLVGLAGTCRSLEQ